MNTTFVTYVLKEMEWKEKTSRRVHDTVISSKALGLGRRRPASRLARCVCALLVPRFRLAKVSEVRYWEDAKIVVSVEIWLARISCVQAGVRTSSAYDSGKLEY